MLETFFLLVILFFRVFCFKLAQIPVITGSRARCVAETEVIW